MRMRTIVPAALVAAGLLAGAATAPAATHAPVCTGALARVAATADELTLSCPDGVGRIAATLNADLAKVGAAKAGHRTLACALVRKHPKDATERFACAGRHPLRGKLHVRFTVVKQPACALKLKLVTRPAPAAGRTSTTALRRTTTACPTAPPGGAGSIGGNGSGSGTGSGTPGGASPGAPSPPASPQPAPGGHAYVITYKGDSTFSLSRRNDFGMSGYYAAFSVQQTLGWTTTYAPVTIDPSAPAAAEGEGSDVLTGSDANHQDDYGVHSTNRHCSSTGAPTDTGENPPTASVTPVPGGVSLELVVTNVPGWPGACDDAETPRLYPFDEDPTIDRDDLDATITLTYAQLDGAPLTVPVSSPPALADQDCSAAADNLTCHHALSWTGVVTIARASGD
jgi:hypothetical protein